jgi:LDH2 family malate/lactate/ureidoglycolate dehydrogenase
MVTGVFAMNLAIKKAASSGIAMVVVRNSCHFGAAGFYAKLAASQGQVGIAMSNDVPSVAAPRSLGPVLGSNPFAFAASSSEQGTMVLDMATSEVAGGKVAAAAAEGKLVPATWLVDAQGQPTTDPNLFLKQQASLAPMAGYKGYGIALMIEILSGALSGASMRKDVGIWMLEPRDEPTDHGHAFISIAPAVFLGEGVFPARLDDLLSGIRGTPVQGGDHVKIPGDIEESKAAKAQLEGIQLPEEVLKLLRVAATENGLSIPVFLN